MELSSFKKNETRQTEAVARGHRAPGVAAGLEGCAETGYRGSWPSPAGVERGGLGWRAGEGLEMQAAGPGCPPSAREAGGHSLHCER